MVAKSKFIYIHLGIPFIFWEQYMTLRSSVALILCCCIVAAFILVSIILLSIRAAVLVILSVLASLAQIFGAMTLLGIKLSALPAVILILSVGMTVCFTVHISLVSYCISLQNTNTMN